VAQGFKMGSAFVEIDVDDKTETARQGIGSKMAKWAGGLALGVTISKGITDNLDIGEASAKLGAQLNLTKDVSSQMGKLSGEVYRDNFGESIPQVNEAIASVGQSLLNLNTAPKEAIKAASEAALGLANVFGTEVTENVRAADSLISNQLAKNSTEAFDLMTRAFQSGGNEAGDLLETITEYAPQFHKLGLDGATALGLLSQGLKAGARDTDVIADSFKEFALRAIDGSTLTQQGFEAIGLKAKDMGAKIAAGGVTAQEGLLQTLTALQNMKDPVAQNTAGVALFGTQWEDTLRQILPKMDLTEAALTDVKGATDKMNKAASDSAKNGIESVKRATEGWLTSVTNMDGPLGTISSWAVGSGSWAIPLLGNIGSIVTAMSAMKLESIATAATTVGSWIGMAAASVANAVVMAASWLLAFWPVALIVAAVIALTALVILNWDTIRTKTVEIWNAIWGWLKGIWYDITSQVRAVVQGIIDAWSWLASLPGKVSNWFGQLRDGAIAKAVELVNWVKSLPGKLLDGLGNLGHLLWDAGAKIIQGLWDGLKSAFEKVKNWVKGIGSWIADHKGPIEVDAVLLIPHGRAFMQGLAGGLQTEFAANVKPTVQGMANELANTTMPVPSVAPMGADGASLAGTASAAGSPPAGIYVENLNVAFPGSLNAMSKTDLREMAEFLRELLRNLDRSQRGSAAA
jgi:minor tail protein